MPRTAFNAYQTAVESGLGRPFATSPIVTPTIQTVTLRASASPVGFSGFSSLGFDPPSIEDIDDILNSAADDPNGTAQKIDDFVTKLGIGQGRAEADVVVPVQNRLMANLGVITQQILTGTHPTVSQLQTFYTQVINYANNFIQFVLASKFTDRRASGQALNTVFPYIDGTCGYEVPIGFVATPTRFECISWGDGTIGGVGLNGILGSLARAIAAAGGSTPGGGVINNPPVPGGNPDNTFMGLSTPLAVGLGVLAIYLFSRKQRG